MIENRTLSEHLRQTRAEYRDKIREQKDGQVIPDITCPIIDKIRESMEEAIEILEHHIEVMKENKIIGAIGIRKKIKKLKQSLIQIEDVRDANNTLRGLSKDWYEIAKDLFSEV